MRKSAVAATTTAIAIVWASGAALAQQPVADRGTTGSLKNQLITYIDNLNGTGGVGQLTAGILALEISTAPLGTAAGAFTYTFDEDSQTWDRETHSFGPMFADRASTTGAHRLSVGANFRHAGYDSLGGLSLSNGEFQTFKNVRPDPTTSLPSLCCLSSASVNLNMSSDTLVTFATFGVTRNVDVGVAVPWMHLDLAASSISVPVPGTAAKAQTTQLAPLSASGVGDIAIFAKYRVWQKDAGGVAATLDMRLPTGDSDSLLGLGLTRTLLSAVWSGAGRVSPHANVGYEFWSKGIQFTNTGNNNPNGLPFAEAKDQLKYAVGVEADATPRLTVIVDLVGRELRSGGLVGYQTVRGLDRNIDLLVATPDGTTALALVPGAKVNVWNQVLITGSVLLSVSNNGLRSKITPVFGLEWAFGSTPAATRSASPDSR